ncbi:MAG TPA: hypothetical protein VM715_15790 [Candidatus Acidoferrum sp.]|nr:hypothetical protein [Candidatus Acidoferrum sp.]
MPNSFTARNVSKFIFKSFIAAKTAQITAETIADHTQFDKDDTVVEVGSTVFGWYVSDRLRPVTDKIVDKTADFITEQRTKFQDKKTNQ